VQIVKAIISRALRSRFRFLAKVYWDDRGLWGKGYFVSTVGINEQVVRKYVGMQSKENTGRAELRL